MDGLDGGDSIPFQDLFSAFDKNGDGLIEKGEFLLFIYENFKLIEY